MSGSGEKHALPQGGRSMYEISTRPWLYSLSQKYGKQITTLSSIPKQEFQAIANLGFDVVWMMGVWELGPYALNFDRNNKGLLERLGKELADFTPDDIIGSPYAVVNYTCNPELGSDNDIKNLRKMLNSMGLLLMLDYVPNHTAVDCPLTTSNKEYFVQVAKDINAPYDSARFLPNGVAYGWAGWGDSWQDTAQVNIWNPDTRKLRTKEVLHVASLSDAIRFDMAFLMLNDEFERIWGKQVATRGYTRPSTEWWVDTIAAVRAEYPATILLAEVYNPYEATLQKLGFDYTYDKTLYDKMKEGNLEDIRGWIKGNGPDFAKHSAHFTSNHDEERSATCFGSWWKANAAAILTYTLPGMRFFWMGEFEGFQHKLAVHARRAPKEPIVHETCNFYNNLLAIINKPIFKQGEWRYVEVKGENSPLIAFHWSLGNERRLCVINYSAQQQGWGSIVLPDAQPHGHDEVIVTELISGDVYTRSASSLHTVGLHVGINSWYGAIYQY